MVYGALFCGLLVTIERLVVGVLGKLIKNIFSLNKPIIIKELPKLL
jgi:hypothetical protein